MGTENQTYFTEFILLGLSSDLQTQTVLFIVFLIIYLLTVFGNLLIIVLIHTDSRLHIPMYFFLKNLSFTDLFLYNNCPTDIISFTVNEKDHLFCWVFNTDDFFPSSWS